MKYILGTDICIFAIKQHKEVLRRLLQESPDDVAISAMTQAELRFGAMKSNQAEKAMAQVDAFLEPLTVLPFDSEAAGKHAEFRYALRSHPIGERDLVIAAVAGANHLTLVTHNAREFARIVALNLEDWTGTGES